MKVGRGSRLGAEATSLSSELDWGGENALTTFGDATLSIHSKLSYWAYKGFYLIGTKKAPRPVKDRV